VAAYDVDENLTPVQDSNAYLFSHLLVLVLVLLQLVFTVTLVTVRVWKDLGLD